VDARVLRPAPVHGRHGPDAGAPAAPLDLPRQAVALRTRRRGAPVHRGSRCRVGERCAHVAGGRAGGRALKRLPMTGIRVLDLSRILAAPLAAQSLGDLGADVIKVERPGRGDEARRWGPPFLKDTEGRDTRKSPMDLSANRNKRSITIDLARPE